MLWRKKDGVNKGTHSYDCHGLKNTSQKLLRMLMVLFFKT